MADREKMTEAELAAWRASMDVQCRSCGMTAGCCVNSPPQYRTNCCDHCLHPVSRPVVTS
jgi:hypothetical protein